MQHAHSLYLEPVDVVGRIQRAIEDFRTSRIQAKAFKNTLRELSNLTDHELADIGVDRTDIVSVAHQAVSAA